MKSAGRAIEAVGAELVPRLQERTEQALLTARKTGRSTLASVSGQLATSVDPAASVLLGARDGLDWAVLEQPDNQRSSVAGLGSVATLTSAGGKRFSDVALQWRDLVKLGSFDDSEGPSGTGPIAIGGFAFSSGPAGAGPWADFGPASLTVPCLALRRVGETTWASLQTCVNPDDRVDDAVEAVEAAIARVDWQGDLTGLQPELSAQPARVSSVLSAAHYESAVSGAIEALGEGRITKVVLAREVIVESETDHDPAAVFAVLREAFPSCFNYAIGRGESTFIGASPELLVRREGARAATIALAGSAPRSADPSVDDHIGERLLRSDKDRREQAIVTDRIVASLNPHSVWVNPASEPSVAKVANIQHLATPIRAQLRDSVSAVELLGALHPTPAVGGEPWSEAQTVMNETEGMDRGWYAAPIGWTDGSEDGEFCVALRGALLKGREARCYAGVGVVEGSDPASELAETELKLQAMLPVLTT